MMHLLGTCSCSNSSKPHVRHLAVIPEPNPDSLPIYQTFFVISTFLYKSRMHSNVLVITCENKQAVCTRPELIGQRKCCNPCTLVGLKPSYGGGSYGGGGRAFIHRLLHDEVV